MSSDTVSNAPAPWSLTTRIICSGVTPLAARAAISEPALVPTYTSNWLTVRSTARRSSARSAPISYTPPVNPPPPSTSAVFERFRPRRRRGERVPISSSTTLPIGASECTVPSGRRRDFGRPQGFPRTDGSDRLHRGAARRARPLARRPGRGSRRHSTCPGPSDAARRRVLGRLRRRPRLGAGALRAGGRRGPHPGLGEQAVHDGGGDPRLRAPGSAHHPGARRRGARRQRRRGRQPLPAR